MKTKKVIIILSLLFSVALIALFCSCNKVVVIESIRMKDTDVIEIAIGDFSYADQKVVVVYKGGKENEIALTEDMIPETERLKLYKVGEQEIKVVYNKRYVTTLKVNVKRHEFEDIYELNGYTCTYDGNPHRVTLNNELPEGAKIEFEYGNTFVNAGTYEVVGVISKEGYVSKTVSATLVIEKAEYDLSGLIMEDVTTVYDGEIKTLQATGVPEGVEVSYEVYDNDIKINAAVGAGEYKIVARFTSADNNYKKISNRQATLLIEKADYDMSGVIFNDYVKGYDGMEYIPVIDSKSVLPYGVSVSYAIYQNGEKVASNAKVGEYQMVASFRGNSVNYNSIPDIIANLTVDKRVITISENIKLDDLTTNYDGEVHSVFLDGQLPQGITVSFENNDQTYAGEYEVIARFNAVNENERPSIEEMRAYLIINQVRGSVEINGHEVSELDFYYDKTTYTMSLLGLDTQVFGIRSFNFYLDDAQEESDKIEWGDSSYALQEGKEYRYNIVFYYLDEAMDRSIRLSGVSGSYVYHDVSFENTTVVYDGLPHTVSAQYVPRAINVTYELYQGDEYVETAVNVGEYLVKACFTYDGQTVEKTVVLTIEKARWDILNVSLDDICVVYDGLAKSIFVVGLPEGVSVTYKYFKNEVEVLEAVNVGEYTVVAYFDVDNNNYQLSTQELSATLTISKRLIALEHISFPDGEFTYNGEEHSIEIVGELPQGATATYSGNGQVNYGEYCVTVVFAAIDEVNEYVDVHQLQAVLIVNKLYFTDDDVIFEDETVDYDRNFHSILAKNLPFGVGVEYNNNEQKCSGTYQITAHFYAENDNVEVNCEDKNATLTINKIYEDVLINGHRISSADFIYNVDTVILDINGFDPEVYYYKHDANGHLTGPLNTPIYFSWEVSSGRRCYLWFYNNEPAGQSNALTGSNYHGEVITYTVKFLYVDPVDRENAMLNEMVGYCIYNVETNEFTEVVQIDGRSFLESDLIYDSEGNVMTVNGLNLDVYTSEIVFEYRQSETEWAPVVWGSDDKLIDGTEYRYTVTFRYVGYDGDDNPIMVESGTLIYHTGDLEG